MNKETKDLYYKMGEIKGNYNFYITGRDTAKQELIKEVRKKTAKEILNGLLDLCNSVQDINQKTDFYYSIELLIAEIKIKYGIEVEE